MNLLGRLLLATNLALAAVTASAQTAATGTITGRVFNPATGEYLRNAQVYVPGTPWSAVSEDGGHYTLTRVPPGETTVHVTYTGYRTAPAFVRVQAGQTAHHDFNLVSSEIVAGREDEAVKLDQVVVSADREGNAKAIMEQRRNMNVANVVASDVFGDVAEGNLGEFVKFLPGVDIEYNGMEARAPRIHGMDPQYAAVTMNGMRLASGDAYTHFLGTNNVDAGEGSRMFSFSEVSLNSIEAVEVFKTNSADMDADAPAGTINLKMKRAFDRKGRRISWQLSAMINSTDFHLQETYGPGDDKHHKYRPGAMLEYSDIYLGGRLGVILTLSQSNMFAPEQRIQPTYQATPTAADGRPLVITAISFLDNPRFSERSTATLTADFKATPRLALSLHTSYNTYALRSSNRTLAFTFAANNTTAAGRSSVLGDGVTSIETSAAGGANRSLNIGGARGFNKVGGTINMSPRFEYKHGPLVLDGQAGYSRSDSAVRGIEHNAVGYTRLNTYTGFNFRAVRSTPTSTDWKIFQVSGADWADLSNFRNPRVADEYRDGKDQVFTSEANARFTLPLRTSSWLKAGCKIQERVRDYEDATAANTWAYVGPNGGTNGSFVDYPSPTPIDMNAMGPQFFGLVSGLPPTIPNRKTLTEAFKAHPEYFSPNPTATNWFDSYVRNTKDLKEQINAAYVLGFARLGRLRTQAGLRWEETRTASIEFDPLPLSQVRAAGYPVSATEATTIPGIAYRYTARPRVMRSGRYDNLFPTFSAKYDFRPNLVGHFGYNQSIMRPGLNHISGLWAIDEVNLRVNVPNPNLLPEKSEKFLARLEYYFEPVGQFGIGGFYNSFQNLRETHEYTAEEFGQGDDPFYSDFNFITQTSGTGTRTIKGYEVDYRQQLAFLPGLLKGTGVYLNYTRTLAPEGRRGVARHHFKGGFSYRYRRLHLGLNAVWYPDTPYLAAGQFRQEQAKYDVNGGFRLTDRISFFFSGRNITNVFDEFVTKPAGGIEREVRYAQYGGMWTFGLKGNF